MKRWLLLMAVACLTALSAQSQRTVTGTVIDSEQQEAVIQATVALLKTDSTVASNAVTNVSGQFSLTAPSDGKFILRITYVGYKALYKDFTMSGKPVSLGTLTLSPDAIMLKGAEVVHNQAKVISRGDTFIYNAGAYRTPEGSVVEELVKKLPGAEVSDDGTVTINGKKVSKVLIDGKEFMTGDTKTAIKNLPTSIVERIKAYDEKSDLSRITGIDDGNEQTVLDFGLKRGMNKGMFSNVDLGIGTKDRYSGRLMGAMMRDDLRLMGFGNANNTNDQGFGGGGGGRFGGGARNGLQASKMAGVNVNYEKKNKLKLNGSVRWNHSDGDAWSRRSTENFVSRTGSFSNSINQNYSRSNSWNSQFRFEWMPDTMTNIIFRPTWSYSSSDSKSGSMSATFSADPYSYADGALSTRAAIFNTLAYMRGLSDTLVVNSRDNGALSYSDSKRFGGELQLNRKLNDKGRNVTLRLTGNSSDGNSESMSTSTVNLYQLMSVITGADSTYQTNRYSLTPQNSQDYSVQATYSEPVFRGAFLQLSYHFQYRHTKSERSTYDFSNPPYAYDMTDVSRSYRQWGNYLGLLDHPLATYLDDDLSRYSEYNNYIHTAEIMLRVIRKAYNFNVGVQMVPQSSRFKQRYQGVDTDTTRHVVNWSPTARLRWRLSERGQMNFEYRGSTSQPSMTDLLDITDDSDPLNITRGNPGLKPSFTQRFNWRFNNYYERHQRFVFANVGFSTTANSVANMVKYDPVTGGRTSQPQNINGNWTGRAEFMLNTAIDTAGIFNVNTRTAMDYAHSVGYIDLNRDGNVRKNYSNSTTLSERLGASYRNDWFEFEINGNVRYNFARNALQSQGNQDTWAFSYGFNTTLQAPWGMQFTTSMGMNSNRGYNDASMNTNELIWNAQLAQSFLKGKPLSITLQFYDILHQQSNISRALSAMSRTDTEYNAINSYVMLHAIYRLNLFGSREARKGMSGRGPGGEGPEGGMGGRGGNRGGRGGGRGGFGGGGFGGGGRF